MGLDLGNLLQKYMSSATPAADTSADDLHQVAQNAPPHVVTAGVAEAFRSDQTPPFGRMIAESFGQADPQHRATILNQLLGNIGSAALAALGTSGSLSSVLGRLEGSSPRAVTPTQASQVTPGQVQEIANHAEQHTPISSRR